MFNMSQAEKNGFVAGLVSLAVYVVVAWVGAKFFGVSTWRALAVLFVARAFFGIIEWAAGVLNWRLFVRRETVRQILEILRSNNFPPRFYQGGNYLDYLGRVQDGDYPEPLKRSAHELERMIGLIESQGIMAAIRIDAAADEALEAYSPKAIAPMYLLHQVARRNP